MAIKTAPHGANGARFAPAFHRPWFRYVDPVDGAEATPPENEPAEPKEPNWKTEARKHEARSKEWKAKAEANEAAAQRLAELEEAQKTEAQKAQDALSQAQADLAQERTARLRAEVSADKGVPAALLAGSTREELEESADALIAFRGESGAAPQIPAVPTVGKEPQRPGNVPITEQIAAAESAGDSALVAQLKAIQLGQGA